MTSLWAGEGNKETWLLLEEVTSLRVARERGIHEIERVRWMAREVSKRVVKGWVILGFVDTIII